MTPETLLQVQRFWRALYKDPAREVKQAAVKIAMTDYAEHVDLAMQMAEHENLIIQEAGATLLRIHGGEKCAGNPTPRSHTKRVEYRRAYAVKTPTTRKTKEWSQAFQRLLDETGMKPLDLRAHMNCAKMTAYEWIKGQSCPGPRWHPAIKELFARHKVPLDIEEIING